MYGTEKLLSHEASIHTAGNDEDNELPASIKKKTISLLSFE